MADFDNDGLKDLFYCQRNSKRMNDMDFTNFISKRRNAAEDQQPPDG